MEVTSETMISPEATERIAANIFQIMPLIKKRLTRMDSIQSEHELPLSHVQVLAMLDQVGSMSVSDISRQFDIAKPNITPLVDRLVNAGLVDRTRSDTDRRVVNIVILDAGRERLREIQESLNSHVRGWQRTLSLDDYFRLGDALEDVVQILEKL